MPETSEKILAQLGDGKVTEKPEILFARLDVEEVMKKVEELHHLPDSLSLLLSSVGGRCDHRDFRTLQTLQQIHRRDNAVGTCKRRG